MFEGYVGHGTASTASRMMASPSAPSKSEIGQAGAGDLVAGRPHCPTSAVGLAVLNPSQLPRGQATTSDGAMVPIRRPCASELIAAKEDP
jgi:hypothetical protein